MAHVRRSNRRKLLVVLPILFDVGDKIYCWHEMSPKTSVNNKTMSPTSLYHSVTLTIGLFFFWIERIGFYFLGENFVIDISIMKRKSIFKAFWLDKTIDSNLIFVWSVFCCFQQVKNNPYPSRLWPVFESYSTVTVKKIHQRRRAFSSAFQGKFPLAGVPCQ